VNDTAKCKQRTMSAEVDPANYTEHGEVKPQRKFVFQGLYIQLQREPTKCADVP